MCAIVGRRCAEVAERLVAPPTNCLRLKQRRRRFVKSTRRAEHVAQVDSSCDARSVECGSTRQRGARRLKPTLAVQQLAEPPPAFAVTRLRRNSSARLSCGAVSIERRQAWKLERAQGRQLQPSHQQRQEVESHGRPRAWRTSKNKSWKMGLASIPRDIGG
eukprot:6715262-Prymnesium_polylepis.2